MNSLLIIATLVNSLVSIIIIVKFAKWFFGRISLSWEETCYYKFKYGICLTWWNTEWEEGVFRCGRCWTFNFRNEEKIRDKDDALRKKEMEEYYAKLEKEQEKIKFALRNNLRQK